MTTYRTELTQTCRMYGTAYKFSKRFFTGWVIVSLLWAIFAFSSVTVYPIIEGRHLLASWAKGLLGKDSKDPGRDEFDHHQHAQRYDDHEASELSEQGVINAAVPVEKKV